MGTSGFYYFRPEEEGPAEQSRMAAGSMDASGRGPGRGGAIRPCEPHCVDVHSCLQRPLA